MRGRFGHLVVNFGDVAKWLANLLPSLGKEGGVGAIFDWMNNTTLFPFDKKKKKNNTQLGPK